MFEYQAQEHVCGNAPCLLASCTLKEMIVYDMLKLLIVGDGII